VRHVNKSCRTIYNYLFYPSPFNIGEIQITMVLKKSYWDWVAGIGKFEVGIVRSTFSCNIKHSIYPAAFTVSKIYLVAFFHSFMSHILISIFSSKLYFALTSRQLLAPSATQIFWNFWNDYTSTSAQAQAAKPDICTLYEKVKSSLSEWTSKYRATGNLRQCIQEYMNTVASFNSLWRKV